LLEVLGDTILKMCFMQTMVQTDLKLETIESIHEIKKMLENNESLKIVAKEMKLECFIRSEQKNFMDTKIAADVVEAILAAIFLDNLIGLSDEKNCIEISLERTIDSWKGMFRVLFEHMEPQYKSMFYFPPI